MSVRRFCACVPLAASILLVSCGNPSAPATPPVSDTAPASSPAPAPAAAERAPAGVVTKAAPPSRESTTAPIPESAPAPRPPAGQVSEMDLGTLFELQGEGRAFLLDVRPAFFYNLGHIPGAISMPLKSFDTVFPARMADIDAAVAAGKVIVIYCTDENCPDGRSTARRMAREGYSTSVYKAGWKEWKDAGL